MYFTNKMSKIEIIFYYENQLELPPLLYGQKNIKIVKAILAIDQGTTSTRAIVFSVNGKKLFSSQLEIKQYFPKNGWVEHNPNEIWSKTLKVIKNVAKNCIRKKIKILTIGITNQRETTVLWDKSNGRPVYNAIVWQDRRTEDFCNTLKAKNKESKIRKKTGLFLDPYF